MNKILVVGIAGGTGSGKTTLTNRLVKEFGHEVMLIHHDDYYKAHDDLSYEERSKLNFDCPEAYDTELLVEHIAELKAGRSVQCPVYDYSIHNRSNRIRQLDPARVVVIEGILILADSRLCELMDIRVFVDTDADVRLARRIRRDAVQRGRSLDSVLEQYFSTVKPMHELYVDPSRKNADIVVLNGGRNQAALRMLTDRINTHLAE